MLDRRFIRRPGLDQGQQGAVQGAEPVGERLVRIGRDDAIGDMAQPAAGGFDEPPAGVLEAGVEAEQPDREGQLSSRCITASETSKFA